MFLWQEKECKEIGMHNCWCGNSNLSTFSSKYAECKVCGTLVSLNPLSTDQLFVHDDEVDFYGKQYWLDHQSQDLGFPDIYIRSRKDLTERNIHWFRTLVRYRLPPGDVLEIGCGHGSFVAFMQQAGYQSSGVEMSQWVVSFGEKTFGIPVYLGPLENIDLSKGSLDVIVMMDVLEHLPNPVTTLQNCLELLRPDGFLLIQTPEFKEGKTYSDLVDLQSPFLGMLQPDEHLNLFSRRSIVRILNELGVKNILFEQAIFADYDMFLVASRVQLETHSSEQVEAALLAHPQSRMTLALLDLRERELALAETLQDSEQDRAARLEQIIILTQQLKEAEVNRQLHITQVEALTQQVEVSTQQVEALTQQVEALNQQLNEKSGIYWLEKLKKLFS
nr:methyltransferase domain-containing protein [Nodosilinea sp. FACHB-131]